MNYLHKRTHTTVPEYMGPTERAMDILLNAARGGTYREDAVSSSGNLAVLDAHIGLLEDVFAELQTKMRCTIAHVKSRRNALLTVSRLPVELFVEIAKLFLDDEDDLQGYSQKMHTLMLVCNQWHRIIHSTPTLWSHLHPWYCTEYIATAIQKSRPSGLSFWQPLDYPVRNSTAYATVVGLLLPEVPRWTDVNISPEVLDKQGLLYLSQHAPKITSFVLDLSGLTREGSLRQPLDLFGGHAPELRTLVLVAVPIPPTSTTLTELTSLRLEFSAYIRPSTLDLLQILEQCPHLTELYLSDEASPAHATACGQATKLIRLPKLLELTFNYLEPDMSHSLFNSLAAPNCVKFKLVSAFVERFAAISLPSSDQLSHSLPLILSCLRTAPTVAVQDPSDDSVEITLAADGDRCVEMELVDYDLSSVLRWLDQVTSGLQTKTATVKFVDSAAGDAEILDALDAQLNVVELFASPTDENEEDQEDFLTYLGTADADSGVFRWPFPNLSKLKLTPLEIDPSSILRTMRSRYGGRPQLIWSGDNDVSRILPRRLSQLYIAGADLDETARSAVSKLVGTDVVVWDDDYVD